MIQESDFQTAPDILYKYRRFDADGKHIRLITHRELWFASAKDFNDPFDTAFRYNLEGLEGELGERWARVATDRHLSHFGPEEREKYAATRLAKLREDPDEIQRMHQHTIDSNYNKWGICSLCKSRDNLLLWAHYSEDHKGFCIGLSVEHLNSISRALVSQKLLLDLHKVTYSPKVPNPNFFEKMLNLEDNSHITEFIATKSPDWGYEQEYRLVFWERANTALQIPPEAIKEIILGCRISNENRSLVLLASRTHLPQAQLLQARKDVSTFALVLEPLKD